MSAAGFWEESFGIQKETEIRKFASAVFLERWCPDRLRESNKRDLYFVLEGGRKLQRAADAGRPEITYSEESPRKPKEDTRMDLRVCIQGKDFRGTSTGPKGTYTEPKDDLRSASKDAQEGPEENQQRTQGKQYGTSGRLA